jgi:hypothetical protein
VTPQHTAGAREILGEGPLLVVEQAVAPTSEREEAKEGWAASARCN